MFTGDCEIGDRPSPMSLRDLLEQAASSSDLPKGKVIETAMPARFCAGFVSRESRPFWRASWWDLNLRDTVLRDSIQWLLESWFWLSRISRTVLARIS